ncbi:hypothetical protein GCM10017714_13510 [Curtobacterium pusillum]|uniref:Uncharacterized protein YacL n=1 Tax=Curtobacterium pusillum TaxID=69373 RepID=A0AAW3T6Q8_9MICO|nr:hypothetical protein [Curtobacterium pusillum]MBA8989898.1 uncharacterized protein YacL [Curtobacterium pusillum]NUU13111.1 hypothetical protein [Curtobacterium pusillum]GLK30612.1 hypothetical protein GCM10017610_08970 [Curtobacterium pusillum]
MIWAIIAVSCAFALVGLTAYTGLWRSWTRSWSADRIFPTAFLGFGGICLGVFAALLSTHAFVLTAVMMIAAFVLILVAVGLFVFGVPAWLTPRWYRHRSST